MSLNILLINENKVDYDRLASQLTENRAVESFSHANSEDSAFSILSNRPIDCIFLDAKTATENPINLFHKINASDFKPSSFFFLTENENEKRTIQKSSVSGINFLDKKNLSRETLTSALEFAASKQQLLSQINSLNFLDDVTNLDNRNSFKKALKNAIAHSDRTLHPFALCILDIDHFKDINDSMGHNFGDMLLQIIGQKLKKNIRETDFIARLGGDEFAIIATNLIDTDGSTTFCKKIINLLATPLYLKHQKVYISVSLGITLYPSDGDNSDTLLSNTEIALYKA